MLGREKEKRLTRAEGRAILLPDYGRKKLLEYADTFLDLAKTYTCQNQKNETLKETVLQQEPGEEMDKQELLTQERVRENRDILAEHLKEMSRIMTKVAGESYEMVFISRRKQRQIFQILKSHGVLLQTIYMIQHDNEQMEVSLLMRAWKKQHFEIEEIAGVLSVFFDRRFVPGKNCVLYLKEEADTYVFEEETKYSIFSGIAKAVKENEKMSGDNYTISDLGNGRCLCALSDGMGSGEKACEDSALVIDLLEKLMEAGFERKKAVALINGLLLSGGEEQNMSTLDVCEIYLKTGLAVLTKAGAAPTFIKRRNSVEILEGGCYPLGIFEECDLEEIKVQLREGDFLIFISDGVTEAVQREDALEEIQTVLEEVETENPRELANYLLQYLIHCCGGNIRDDITVMTIRMQCEENFQSSQ